MAISLGSSTTCSLNSLVFCEYLWRVRFTARSELELRMPMRLSHNALTATHFTTVTPQSFLSLRVRKCTPWSSTSIIWMCTDFLRGWDCLRRLGSSLVGAFRRCLELVASSVCVADKRLFEDGDYGYLFNVYDYYYPSTTLITIIFLVSRHVTGTLVMMGVLSAGHSWQHP